MIIIFGGIWLRDQIHSYLYDQAMSNSEKGLNKTSFFYAISFSESIIQFQFLKNFPVDFIFIDIFYIEIIKNNSPYLLKIHNKLDLLS